MKTLLRILLIIGALAVLGVPAYFGGAAYWKSVTATKWRTADVEKGGIISVVNSTGTVKPREKIIIGAFVSGPILPDKLPDFKDSLPDFNDPVMAGQVIARIDPMIYDANVRRDQANFESRDADVKRVKAQLQQAINDERRALDLRAEDKTFIAPAEMDKFKFARMSLDAQLIVAEASAKQAKESYKYSETQRAYTEIKAPKDGIIINRKIEPGQTLASQFQAPELFEIGVGMREEMQIHAAVDEADIGRIQLAQDRKLPVSFTVDAYDELFHGAIDQIRLNSTTTQNVVTYPVVVKTPNPDLKLLPGMTAAISFRVDERKDVVKIPNSALRFFPLPKQVRKEDIPLLEGTQIKDDEQESQQSETTLSAEERAENRRKRNRRHVWVQEGDLLKAVEVVVGLTDSQFTEMVSGSLQPGAKLIIGIQQPQYGR
ncbi:MAG: efflux RND transporter periplasmic adaptor subunit [Pirellulaceae bacterium]